MTCMWQVCSSSAKRGHCYISPPLFLSCSLIFECLDTFFNRTAAVMIVFTMLLINLRGQVMIR